MRTAVLVTTALLALATVAEAQETQRYGDMTVSRTSDAMTDATQWTVATMDGPANPLEGRAGLGWYCEEGDGPMMVVSMSGFTMEERRMLMLRFDNQRPTRRTWTVKQNGTDVLVFTLDREEVRELLARAKGARRLVVRDTEDGTDYVFSLMGLSEALDRVPCLP